MVLQNFILTLFIHMHIHVFDIVPKSKCNNQNTTFMVILHGLRPTFGGK